MPAGSALYDRERYKEEEEEPSTDHNGLEANDAQNLEVW